MMSFLCKQINGKNLFVRVLNVSSNTKALWIADGEEDCSTSYTFTSLLGLTIFQPVESFMLAKVLVLLGTDEDVTDIAIGQLDSVTAEQLCLYLKNNC